MLISVPDCVEVRMWIAQFRSAGLQIMQQRMNPADAHVRVVLDIPVTVKEWVGVALFAEAPPDEVRDWREIAVENVGIALEIPIRIEKSLHLLSDCCFSQGFRLTGNGLTWRLLRHDLRPTEQSGAESQGEGRARLPGERLRLRPVGGFAQSCLAVICDNPDANRKDHCAPSTIQGCPIRRRCTLQQATKHLRLSQAAGSG